MPAERSFAGGPMVQTIRGPWSPGVRVGPLVFTSGQTPVDPATSKVVSSDISEQVQQTIRNVGTILGELGAELSDIVKVVIYLRDYADFPSVNDAYEAFFTPPYPARTCITVASLPVVDGVFCRLIIDAVAYREAE